MKHLLTLTALIIGLFLAGCSSPQSSPSGTVEAFMKASQKGDIEAAIELIDPEILAQPGAKAKLTGMMEKGLAEEPVDSFRIIEEENDGDTAKVKVEITSGDKTDTDTIPLIMREGKWYLSMG